MSFFKLLCFVSFLLLQQCVAVNITDVIPEGRLVKPGKAAFDRFLIKSKDVLANLDGQELLSNRTIQAETAEQLADLLRNDESAYPFVVHVPNSALFPFIRSQINIGIQEVLNKLEEVKADITKQEVDVTVPTLGDCKNTYRTDIMIQLHETNCILEDFCIDFTINLGGVACVNINVEEWTLNLDIVHQETNIDGVDLMGVILTLFLKRFEMDKFVQSQFAPQLDSIRLDELIRTYFLDKMFDFEDSFAAIIEEVTNSTAQDLEQFLDKFQVDLLETIKRVVNISTHIDTNNLVFTILF
eukprot:TRINITY_DN15388_c1_g1_i1.p1 TRINITY_DN15388_c1_g1~~TRINITY_DN15388_c1_g1_i1.p1  ORF type:complete len:299 (+),score=29.00 TRINITY_DN15388_c1_g1_i1:152-1048(+)